MRSQLTDANITNIGGNPWAAKYIYHDNGDMYKRTLTGKSQAAFTYIGNLMDTASGGESFNLDWDDNGQLTLNDQTTGDDTSLVWNWDGNLRSATKGSKSVSLKYDPYGNRIIKDVNDGQTTRKYIVDIVGDLPVILLEIDTSDSSIAKTYIYANSQVLAQHAGKYDQPIYFYLHDRLGSVRNIINSSGNVVVLYTYNPFGETLEVDGTFANPFKFAGQYRDSETDFDYLRARIYYPYIQRFTSRDPILGQFENPLTLHAYLYCLNDPVNSIDPSGLWYIDINASIAYWGGATYGIIFSPEGVYIYFGGGIITPPGGFSVTWAPQDEPATRWNVGLQGGLWGGGQGGYSFSDDGDFFWEIGLVTPGASLTVFYVWKLW